MTQAQIQNCSHPFRAGEIMEVIRGGGHCSICGEAIGEIKRWQDRVASSGLRKPFAPDPDLAAACSEIADLRNAVVTQNDALKAALEALSWGGTEQDRRKALDLASEAVKKFGRVSNSK